MKPSVDSYNQEYLNFLSKVRSYRRFTARRVTEEQMNTLLSAASLSHSAGNLQRLRFAPILSAESCAMVYPRLAWAGYLPDWDGPLPEERPTAYLLMLAPQKDASHFLVGVDTGICAQNILSTAHALGLGGCIIRNFEQERLLSLLALDSTQWSVVLVLALGEPKETVRLVPVTDGNIRYYRDPDSIHYVPKYSPEELILLPPDSALH